MLLKGKSWSLQSSQSHFNPNLSLGFLINQAVNKTPHAPTTVKHLPLQPQSTTVLPTTVSQNNTPCLKLLPVGYLITVAGKVVKQCLCVSNVYMSMKIIWRQYLPIISCNCSTLALLTQVFSTSHPLLTDRKGSVQNTNGCRTFFSSFRKRRQRSENKWAWDLSWAKILQSFSFICISRIMMILSYQKITS